MVCGPCQPSFLEVGLVRRLQESVACGKGLGGALVLFRAVCDYVGLK